MTHPLAVIRSKLAGTKAGLCQRVCTHPGEAKTKLSQSSVIGFSTFKEYCDSMSKDYKGADSPKKARLLNIQAWPGMTDLDIELAPVTFNPMPNKLERRNRQVVRSTRLATYGRFNILFLCDFAEK